MVKRFRHFVNGVFNRLFNAFGFFCIAFPKTAKVVVINTFFGYSFQFIANAMTAMLINETSVIIDIVFNKIFAVPAIFFGVLILSIFFLCLLVDIKII